MAAIPNGGARDGSFAFGANTTDAPRTPKDGGILN